MEQLTTYLAEGREVGLKFLFKYNLNGFLAGFEVTGEQMNEQQVDWLAKVPDGELLPRFPFKEADFKGKWLDSPAMLKKFTISIQPPDLSFDALWNLYNHKRNRPDAIKAYKKLEKKPDDLIKCFMAVPFYLEFLNRPQSPPQMHLSTFINGRRYEDELPTTPPPKQYVGKVFNNALKDLAGQKTRK
jgi:hypothetical protein